jgi:DNA-binding CsgD family transcriptional regulator
MLRLFEEMARADDLAALEQTYLRRAREYVDMPMYGLYLFDAAGAGVERIAVEGVSDYFVSRYERVRGMDLVLDRVLAEGEPVSNTMVMPVDAWLRHPVFREAGQLHDMIWVIEAPALAGERTIGTLNFGGDRRRGPPTAGEREIAAALGQVVGIAVDVVRRRCLEAEAHAQMTAALDCSATPVVVTDGLRGARHVNASAAALLARIVDGHAWIDRLTARSNGETPSWGEAEVALVEGGRTRLRARTRVMPDFPTTSISVLHLDGVGAVAPVAHLGQLTPREREVAGLVAEALTDHEIGERLCLSPHTVREYVKAIYRKLGIKSRVALARVVLNADE